MDDLTIFQVDVVWPWDVLGQTVKLMEDNNATHRISLRQARQRESLRNLGQQSSTEADYDLVIYFNAIKVSAERVRFVCITNWWNTISYHIKRRSKDF